MLDKYKILECAASICNEASSVYTEQLVAIVSAIAEEVNKELKKKVTLPSISGTGMDLVKYIYDQRAFSFETFGPGARTPMVLDHLRKELKEVEANPNDLEEWVDVIILALDGAWRTNHFPEEIASSLEAKLSKNKQRQWPDWRKSNPNKAIEHIRE